MGTKKGDRRKTARRAYTKKKASHRKGRTIINALPWLAGAYAAEVVANSQFSSGLTTVDAVKASGYNPFSVSGYGISGFQAAVQGVQDNKKALAIAAALAIAGEWAGKNTSIGRKMALKGKKYEVRLL